MFDSKTMVESQLKESIPVSGLAHAASSSPLHRAALLGHEAAIVWLTGLSGAGKSTLAFALDDALLRARVMSAVLDGDALRNGLSRGLGFSAGDRKENMRRTGEAAALVASAGAVAIVALISPFREERRQVARRARAHGIAFAEVFVNATLAACEERDPRRLYRQARAGEIRDFTGIDSPYEPPVAPDLELRTDLETVAQSTEKLIRFTLALIRPVGHASGIGKDQT